MFSQEEKALLFRSLMARRDQIKSDHRLSCEVVQGLRQVGASQEAIAPHQSYIELHLHELAELASLMAKVMAP